MKRLGWILTALILAEAVANLNLTVALVALPAIGDAFEASQVQLNLVAVGYSLGLAGSVLLLVSSNEAFSVVVPFLLLAATLAFLLSDRIRAWAAKNSRSFTPFGAAGLFATSVYGGYFNGGLGIVMLALFSLWGMTNIHAMNGLKNGLSFALSAISVGTFALAGIVAWPQAIIMMVAATVGGYLGAHIARALPKRVVQGIVATVGFGMSLTFFLRLVV